MVHTASHLLDHRVGGRQCILKHRYQEQVLRGSATSIRDILDCKHHVVMLMTDVILAEVVACIDVTCLEALESSSTIGSTAVNSVKVVSQVFEGADAIVSFRSVQGRCKPLRHGRAQRTKQFPVALGPVE